MRLVEQWNRVERGLDPRWSEVLLTLEIHDDERRRRAAALLGPAAPGLAGSSIRLSASRGGGAGVGPEAVRRMLRRIDAEGIVGTLAEVGVSAARETQAAERPRLAGAWDDALAELPSDWSDLLCELDLSSSDDVDRAALVLAPLNPIQAGRRTGSSFRFRCAREFGYGVSPGVVRRRLARLDDENVRGDVRVVRALSDTHPVGTQGPVWMLGGRAT